METRLATFREKRFAFPNERILPFLKHGLAQARSLMELDGEADISTKQARAQAPAWVSRADGDRRRSTDYSRTAGPRSQAAISLKLLYRWNSARVTQIFVSHALKG
jgi:hypothetical protein